MPALGLGLSRAVGVAVHNLSYTQLWSGCRRKSPGETADEGRSAAPMAPVRRAAIHPRRRAERRCRRAAHCTSRSPEPRSLSWGTRLRQAGVTGSHWETPPSEPGQPGTLSPWPRSSIKAAAVQLKHKTLKDRRGVVRPTSSHFATTMRTLHHAGWDGLAHALKLACNCKTQEEGCEAPVAITDLQTQLPVLT